MRREGRQHGWVRTGMILPPPYDPKPKSRIANVLDAPPAAGIFAKVPSKPTNHSKFTSRCSKTACSGCRCRPACKSRGKAKGSGKLQGVDAARIVGRQAMSAMEVVGKLTGEDEDEYDFSDGGGGREEEEEEEEVHVVECSEGGVKDCHDHFATQGWDGEWFLVGISELD